MPWECYDSLEHKLVAVLGTSALAQAAREEARIVVPVTEAVLPGFVAECGKRALSTKMHRGSFGEAQGSA
jgi:hypothetical protein